MKVISRRLAFFLILLTLAVAFILLGALTGSSAFSVGKAVSFS